MTTRRIVAVALVAASLGGTAAEAKPKPKPWTTTYDVFLPQPWAVGSAGMGDCTTAPSGLSKDDRPVSIAGRGSLSTQLSGYVGEWAIAVYDANGRLLASTRGTGGQLVMVKHKGGKQSYRVAVCNYAGGPHGTVRLTYKPS